MKFGFLILGLMGCAAASGDDGATHERDLVGAHRLTEAEAAQRFVAVDGQQVALTTYAPGEHYYLGEHVDEPTYTLTPPLPPTAACSEMRTYENVPDVHVAWHCTIEDCYRVYTTYYVEVVCGNNGCGSPAWTCTVDAGCPFEPHSIAMPTGSPAQTCFLPCNIHNQCSPCTH